MKFSEIKQEQWGDLEPYLDTVLLPITGLQGTEMPWEVTQALERLRDALDCIEIPFKGRIVTYPAFHFVHELEWGNAVNTLCSKFKQAGFAYVIVLNIEELTAHWKLDEADLVLQVDPHQLRTNGQSIKETIALKVQKLWF